MLTHADQRTQGTFCTLTGEEGIHVAGSEATGISLPGRVKRIPPQRGILACSDRPDWLRRTSCEAWGDGGIR